MSGYRHERGDALARAQVPSPLVRPFITAVRQTDHLDVVLVQATDADGRRGYGEAATSWRVTGRARRVSPPPSQVRSPRP